MDTPRTIIRGRCANCGGEICWNDSWVEVSPTVIYCSLKCEAATKSKEEHICANCGIELNLLNRGEVLTFNGKDFHYCVACSYEYKELEVQEEKPKEALRFNDGKTPYAYLPLDLLDGAARVMEYGGKKYGDPENYRKGYSDLRNPLSSLLRHVEELQRAIAAEDTLGSEGHLIDKESGFGHIHHILTSAMLLLHSMRLKGYTV